MRGREAAGGRSYGGVFNTNEAERIRSLFPLSLSQAAAHRIAGQVYQGLVRLDPTTLEPVAALADNWVVDSTGLVYTFQLRPEVRFHDHEMFPDGRGRALTVKDIEHCFRAICTYSEVNQMFWLFQGRVKGADEWHERTREGRPPVEGGLGIEVVDDRHLRITLDHPVPNFLQVLAHQGCWIYPPELVARYGPDGGGQAVGTGPFAVRVMRPGEVIILERWQDYWETDEHGNALPFLDAVRITFEPDKARELDEFLRGRLTAVFEVPVDRIGVLRDSLDKNGVPRFKVRSVPGLTTQFYGFNLFRPPFKDVRVRRAFAMAINRQVIVDSVLHGLAVSADHGLVPPGMTGYPYAMVEACSFDPDAARAMLADAGYPGGRGFPKVLLQVNSDGFGYVRVAEAVQTMLDEVLHVNTTISVLPAEQHYDRIELGQAAFWREGWIADYPDPENFLALLHGRNAVLDTAQRTFLNNTRYHAARFDSLFTVARAAKRETERLRGLAAAERIAMEDVPILPLYHDRNIRLEQPWVQGLAMNGMEYRDLSRVWFDPHLRP